MIWLGDHCVVVTVQVEAEGFLRKTLSSLKRPINNSNAARAGRGAQDGKSLPEKGSGLIVEGGMLGELKQGLLG